MLLRATEIGKVIGKGQSHLGGRPLRRSTQSQSFHLCFQIPFRTLNTLQPRILIGKSCCDLPSDISNKYGWNMYNIKLIPGKRNYLTSSLSPEKTKSPSKNKTKKSRKNNKQTNKNIKVSMKNNVESAESVQAPPAYLYQTASPNVYVASCAAEEFNLDPKQLFLECYNTNLSTVVPSTFKSCQFHYFSPRDFGYELPIHHIPEVAILGRSNVGKSSLINALTRKKNLARISKQPGRTQQVNYFGLVPNSQLSSSSVSVQTSHPKGYLIDLPGYGYAKAPDEKVQEWQSNTQTFLENRRDAGVLKRVYMLIDSRHGPAMFDRAVMGWFDEADIPYSIVLTKADRNSKAQIVRFTNEICMRYHFQMYGDRVTGGDNGDEEEEEEGSLPTQGPFVHVTSSRSGDGIAELMWSVHGDFLEELTEI